MPKAKTGSAKASKAAAKRKVVEDSTTENDWSKLTVAQLKEECKNKGLSTTGRKDELIQRLEESDAEGPVPKLVRQSSEGTKKVKAALDAIVKSAPKKRNAKPDSYCCLSGNIAVYDEFDCMLNQTNISQNNNKFYVIQLLEDTKAKKYYLWTRWGRVGEPGANELKGPLNKITEAENLFKKKFKDKTKNDWEKRDDFKPFSGKYTLLDMGDEDEQDEVDISKKSLMIKKEENEDTLESTLDKDTQYLISLIFDDKTFVDAMEKLQLDVKKMPLGALSQSQIAKGFDALVNIENAIKNNRPQRELETLSSTFYTLIPHSFGRQRPPVISDILVVRAKKDMLIVLSDIEIAQSMQKEKKGRKDTKTLKPHPLDEKYELLKCNITLLNKNNEEYKMIETYVKNTGCVKLKKVWRVERSKEEAGFKEFDSVDNRRMLWHGTNVAVVAAILKEGLRIMPHSGGRVGRGLYFASENSKSSGYVGYASNGDGIMFLNEVVLGKEHHITRDDSSLTSAPKGYHSVIAKGYTEPDPNQDTVLKLDNKKIIVPQGKPISTFKSYSETSFSQSEYLVYKENQVRIRYLILISWK